MDLARPRTFAVSESEVSPGLCRRCAHARRIESDRGSVFWLCRLADTDRSFPRYPVLPVLACRGFQATDGADGPGDEP